MHATPLPSQPHRTIVVRDHGARSRERRFLSTVTRPAHTGGVVDIDWRSQAQLAAVGIRAKIDVQESTTYFDSVLGGKLPGLFLFAWIPDYPDTLNFIHGLFGVAAGPQLGTTYAAIATPAASATTENDPAKRKALIAQANDAIKREVPIIPVAQIHERLEFFHVQIFFNGHLQ